MKGFTKAKYYILPTSSESKQHGKGNYSGSDLSQIKREKKSEKELGYINQIENLQSISEFHLCPQKLH